MRTVIIAMLCFCILAVGYAQEVDLEQANLLAWHPSGDFLAIAGADGLWIYSDDFELLTHTDMRYILQIVWSPDGSMLLIHYSNGNYPSFVQNLSIFSFNENAVFDSEVKIIENDSGEDTFRFGFVWSSDSEKIAIVNGETDSISIYHLNGDLVTLGEQDFNFTYAIDWHPDGSIIAVEARDDGISLWDAETGEYFRMLTYSAEGLLSSGIHFNSDGSLLMAGTVIPLSIQLWDIETGEFVFEPDTSSDVSFVRQSAWSPDDSFIVYNSRMSESCRFGGISIENTSTWAREDVIYAPTDACIHAFDLHPSGSHLTWFGYDGFLYDWEIGTEEATRIEGIQFAMINY